MQIRINFKNHELLKLISDQIRLLSWALAAIYYYFGITTSKIYAVVSITIGWITLQIFALLILDRAQKFKKE